MHDPQPASLGDRLDTVALVCAGATATVLVTNLLYALTLNTTSGAVASPVRQRIIEATRPAGLTLALVVLVGAAALAVGRWLHGDDHAPRSGTGTFVGLMAATVAVLALVGLVAELLWQLPGAVWGWQAAQVGQHTAAALLGGLAWWLALPARR